MKKIVSFGLLVFVSGALFTSGVYNYTVPKLEGGTQSLADYQGKKILIITLPLAQSPAADSLLYALDTLGAAHTNNLKIIAVPSIEDGYLAAQQAQLQQWYRSKLGNHILITSGLYTKKVSGAQQHPLFKWLSSDVQNGMFDIDAAEPGYKYVTDEQGELYGVLHPQSKISGTTVQRTLQL
jgi:glutathione peroxidase